MLQLLHCCEETYTYFHLLYRSAHNEAFGPLNRMCIAHVCMHWLDHNILLQ